jgi:Protein of unknown function (DUF1822)
MQLMTDSSPLSDLLDWTSLHPDGVELTPAQMDQAAAIGRSLPQSQRWSGYLSTLARLGFETWLNDRAPDLEITHWQSKTYGQDVVYHLQVGSFNLCLITPGVLLDSSISIPCDLLDRSDRLIHFYSLLEVIEEQQHVRFYGYLSQAQVQQQRLVPEADLTYTLPLSQFNPSPDSLLLQLRCLDAPQPILAVSAKQRAAVLPVKPINVARWLQNQLDQVARDLEWTLLSAFAPTAALRDGSMLREIRHELDNQGTRIPSEAGGAYHVLRREGEEPLLLCLFTWQIPSHEWMLMAIVAQKPMLPIGLSLRIQDEQQTLIEQVVQQSQACLYGQVAGAENETFLITITLPDGSVFDLPPFTFSIEISG